MFRRVNTPAFWGVTYILAVPLFASLFWFNSSSFIFSNIHSSAEIIQLRGQVSRIILDLARPSHSMICPRCGSNIDLFTIERIEPHRISGHFTVRDTYKNPISGKESDTWKFGAYYIIHFHQNDEGFNALFMISDDHNHNMEWQAGSFGETSRQIVRNSNDAHAIKRLLDSSNSVFETTRPSYSNFLYLSIVTITTLGYGDIVPISSAGRVLIAIESLTGIVLMGFFLNAVGRKIRNN